MKKFRNIKFLALATFCGLSSLFQPGVSNALEYKLQEAQPASAYDYRSAEMELSYEGGAKLEETEAEIYWFLRDIKSACVDAETSASYILHAKCSDRGGTLGPISCSTISSAQGPFDGSGCVCVVSCSASCSR